MGRLKIGRGDVQLFCNYEHKQIVFTIEDNVEILGEVKMGPAQALNKMKYMMDRVEQAVKAMEKERNNG